MTNPFKYLALLLIILAAVGVNAQETGEEEGESNDTQYVQVDKNSPDAVVLEDPDQYGDPVVGLDLNDEVEVLDETKDGYVKVRVKVGDEWKEGWVKESILGDEPVSPEIDSEAADPYDASKAATAEKGSVGMEPIDTTGMNDPAPVEDPWEHIDPVGTEAKLESNAFPYHIVIPAGLIVGGVAAALILTNQDSEPDPPNDPIVEDPDFALLNDSSSVLCGQSLLIHPLQNDVGTGLFITGINNAPEGVELLNESTISIPASLAEDVTFTIDVEDAVGQTGNSEVSITVVPVEIAANNDSYSLNQGENMAGNVLNNDLCFGCEVVDASGGIGILEMAPNGDFQFFSPEDFWGEVVYTITIQNPCGAEDTSNLIFNIAPTDCDLVLINDTVVVNAGEVVEGNALDNDACIGCMVTSVADAEGTLEWDAEGNFSYTAPDNFEGQVVFVVSVTDACDQEGTQNLVIIVENPPCAFDWPGQVETTPSDCGLDNGAAIATEELFGPYNFSWSNGVEGPENSDLTADTYQLYVTDTVSGCSDTLDAIIDELLPDYSLDVEIVPGDCGATDNVLLFSNASPDSPITIDLSGSTSGTFLDNSVSPVDLSDLVQLNPGDLTITVWADDIGPECSQSMEITLNQAPTPELIIQDTGPDFVVLDILNAVFPVDVFVNGAFHVAASASPAFIEGLPPGINEIFVVDATGCMSPVIIVDLNNGEGLQDINLTTLRWSPQNQSSINWINTPQHIWLKSHEGTDVFYPVGTPTSFPVIIGLERGKWVSSFAFSNSSYQHEGAGHSQTRRINYLEWAVGNKMDVFGKEATISVGYAEWHSNSGDTPNTSGWFTDALTTWPVNSINAQVQVGLRAGIINGLQELIVLPKIQCTFSK